MWKSFKKMILNILTIFKNGDFTCYEIDNVRLIQSFRKMSVRNKKVN